MTWNVDITLSQVAPPHGGPPAARTRITDAEKLELDAAENRHGGGGPPGELLRRLWQSNRAGGRFYTVQLPTSAFAEGLLGTSQRYDYYGEFDTSYEAEAWKEYLYDPLRVLMAERIRLPASGRLGINILKLEDTGAPEPVGYRQATEDRGIASMILLKRHYGGRAAYLAEIKQGKSVARQAQIDALNDQVLGFFNSPGHGDPTGVEHISGRPPGTIAERTDALEAARGQLRVTTTVLNHEVALNPRIGMT